MIKTRKDLKKYLAADLAAMKQSAKHLWLKQILWPNEVLKFERLLRYTEYYTNNREGIKGKLLFPTYLYYKWRLRKQSIKLNFSIPCNVFGPGLAIAHYGTIVVNGATRVGAFCRLHAGVNIGTSGGGKNAPQLGDNVYIGPGAILFGDITIANNVTIGANATVNKSFEQENVVLAGTPAKVVKENAPAWVEFNRIKIIDE